LNDWSSRVAIKLVLTFAILIQGWIVATGFVLPLRHRIRTVATLSAFERGARMGFGDDFAEFIAFLREVVPENSTIVVPHMAVDEVYGNTALMTFFLLPRTIKQCNNDESFEACAQRYNGEDTYILSTPRYQPDEFLKLDRRWIHLNGASGIYAPQS